MKNMPDFLFNFSSYRILEGLSCCECKFGFRLPELSKLYSKYTVNTTFDFMKT